GRGAGGLLPTAAGERRARPADDLEPPRRLSRGDAGGDRLPPRRLPPQPHGPLPPAPRRPGGRRTPLPEGRSEAIRTRHRRGDLASPRGRSGLRAAPGDPGAPRLRPARRDLRRLYLTGSTDAPAGGRPEGPARDPGPRSRKVRWLRSPER